MKISKLLLLIFTVCSLMGCEGLGGAGHIPKSKSFVNAPMLLGRSTEGLQIKQHPDYPEVIIIYQERMNSVSDETYLEKYGHYGDDHYNKHIIPGSNQAIVNNFTGITIKCGKQFNSYPAAAPLDGIARLLACSPYKYIRSNYKSTFDWSDNTPPELIFGKKIIDIEARPEYHPVSGLLSELGSNNLILLNPLMYIELLEIPEEGTYKLYITFHEGDKKRTEWVTMEFDKQ